MRGMRVDSWKFWIVVLSIIAFDMVILGQLLFKPVSGDTDPQHWDFRIAELRQLETNGHYLKNSQPIAPITTASQTTIWQSWHWIDQYFPGQHVSKAMAPSWEIVPIISGQPKQSDSRGQVL
jgi:hypothetical protein